MHRQQMAVFLVKTFGLALYGVIKKAEPRPSEAPGRAMIRAASQTHTGDLMRSLARFCPAILCVATLTAAAAEAQYPVQSPEFPVNAVTTGDQRDPDVAVMGQTGKMILVWASGSPTKVTGRIFNEQGAPLSSEFVINNYTGDQYAARVAADLAGNFVVVWSDPDRNDGNIFFERRNENNVTLNTRSPSRRT